MLFSILALLVTLFPFMLFPFYNSARKDGNKEIAVKILNDGYIEGKPDDYAIVCSEGRWYDRHGKRTRNRQELEYRSCGLYAFKLE